MKKIWGTKIFSELRQKIIGAAKKLVGKKSTKKEKIWQKVVGIFYLKNIFETYETKENAAAKFADKDELPPFTFSIRNFENNPCLLLTDKNGKTFRFIGEEVT